MRFTMGQSLGHPPFEHVEVHHPLVVGDDVAMGIDDHGGGVGDQAVALEDRPRAEQDGVADAERLGVGDGFVGGS